MPDSTSISADRLAQVEHYIREFSRLAEKYCSKADIEILDTCLEDEDAHLVVYVPKDFGEERTDRLSATLTKWSTKVLLNTGILILVGVYEFSERMSAS